MRPTGKLHLGHLVGALKNWVALQDTYDCYYFVADWHALTSHYAETGDIVENALDNAADWIAAGLDPGRSTLFVQSLIPEHAELGLLLGMVTPIPWLERVPTYKEQIDQLNERDLSSIGFLGYPLLQTADVTMYDAAFVPVGDDQVPHLELSREIVRRFNNFYGDVLTEPQALLTPTPRLPGLDNRKMSKSYGNTIDLSDSAETVKQKVRQMYTGSEAGPRRHPGHGRGQSGLHLPRRLQPERRRGRRFEGALSCRQGRRRRGEDEARRCAEQRPRADAPASGRRPRQARITSAICCSTDRARARKDAAEKMDRVREAMKLRYR